MMKATLRSAVLLGLLAAGAMPSFAEVQNVKVGGDVTVRGFYRQNLDLHGERNDKLQGADTQNFFMQTSAINVAADLTENVSAFVRFSAERDWNVDNASVSGTAVSQPGVVTMSQSYITLKELFYSPLTLRVGRQPIVWGRGFVLGSNLFPDVNTRGDDHNRSITANEYTDYTAFPAIRATLDLSHMGGMSLPLTADYVYIKSNEGDVNASDDVNIQGINFSSHFDSWGSEAEAYYLNKRDKSSAVAGNDNFGSVNTIGLRGSAKPVSGSSVWAELAYQFGKNAADPAGVARAGEATQAWATNLGAEFSMADVMTKPKLGAEWRFYSGKDVDGARGGWAPIAPGYFTTALREFQTQSTVAGFYPVDQANATSAGTNQHELAVFGGFSPIEDLSISPRLSFFFTDKGVIPVAGSKRKNYIGAEWDTNVVYNYTEDVQVGLLYAMFAPGNVFRTPNDSVAQEIVTTVGVKF